MNKFTALYRSSVGKKIIMSLSGLFLCTFLVVHVVINLFLFKRDGGEMYNRYSEFMSTNPFIRVIEIVLFAGLIAHVISGVVVWLKNRTSRPVGYEMYRLRDNTTFTSRTPTLTASASLVAFFLVVHLKTFWVPNRFWETAPQSNYDLVAAAFSDPVYSLFYIVALIFLAFHLRHGFQAGFQTLGLSDKRYKWLIDGVAVVFWLLIPLVFAAMPAYFLWFK
jgi:succinate dehydrogenase / fumarate reductase, cytochrome b subunit